MLTGEKITVRYGGRTVLDRVSFRLEEGQWLMLVGPNGAGKTTLIEAVAQGVPYTGAVLWNGQDLRKDKPAQLARKIGVLSQNNRVGYAYTVEEVAALGRYAYRKGLFSGPDREDEERVRRALSDVGMTELKNASMLTLSGGEMQRAFLAQVFAQDPRVLILDEPANHLDLKYQQQVFSLIGEWLRQPDRAVLSVVHDLSLARRFGTHALLLDQGACVSRGLVDQVLTRENLRQVYDMDVYAWLRDMLVQWR